MSIARSENLGIIFLLLLLRKINELRWQNNACDNFMRYGTMKK